MPLNALLALVTPGDLNGSALASAGFRLAALEVPVGVGAERVVVDAVLWHPRAALLIACECKSGANVEAPQALKYAALDAQSVVHAASIDVREDRPRVASLYVALEQHATRVLLGLVRARVTFPALAVSGGSIDLRESHLAPAPLAAPFGSGPLALPYGIPRIVPCDHESAAAVVQPHVKAVLVSHLSRSIPEASVELIAAETLTHLVLYGRAARGRFLKTVTECCRHLAAEDPGTFEYRPGTGNHDPIIRFARTPEENDNRGRTQAYQALARRGHTRQRPPERNPDQLDLLRELGDGGTDRDGNGDEEESG